MNLVYLVDNINDIDEKQIIFQESPQEFESEIILDYGNESDSGGKQIDCKCP